MNRTAMVDFILRNYRFDSGLSELQRELMYMTDSTVRQQYNALQPIENIGKAHPRPMLKTRSNLPDDDVHDGHIDGFQ